MTVLEVEFTDKDESDLREFKQDIGRDTEEFLNRRKVTLPAIGTPQTRAEVEQAIHSGQKVNNNSVVNLPRDLIEAAKATFTRSGGNISEVAALHDMTPEAVIRLANNEDWPIYGGGTKFADKKSRGQLLAIQEKLWKKIEKFLDSLDVEKKQKTDIVQYRTESKYVEPLASRNQTFKTLMDQYMRIGAILEPEIYGEDPDPSNYHAKKAREDRSIESVNREIENFVAGVVVNLADRVKNSREEPYEVIDVRAQ